MRNVLAALEHQLLPLVARRGFTLTDVSVSDCGGNASLQLLGFRAGSPGQRLVLLDLCHLLDRQTIAVEIWSPDDLAEAPAAAITSVAIRHHVWSYGSRDDPSMLVQANFREVASWIAAYEPADRIAC